MSHNPADISLIVQGPILPVKTARFIRKSKAMIPKCEVIVSTWEGADLSDIEADKFLLHDDPGPSKRIMGGKIETCSNINRHLVSTREGINAASRKYCIKLRSDSWLSGTAFLKIRDRFPVRNRSSIIFKERIVVPTAITINPDFGDHRLFHVSDLFYFGLTEDLQKLWTSLPQFVDPNNEVNEDDPLRNALKFYSAEQYLFIHAFDPKISTQYKCPDDATSELKAQFERWVANNFMVACPRMLGVCFDKWRYGFPLGSWHLTTMEWQKLYRQYCDPSYKLGFDWERLFKRFFDR